jgi:hypothetical protein
MAVIFISRFVGRGTSVLWDWTKIVSINTLVSFQFIMHKKSVRSQLVYESLSLIIAPFLV